MSSCWVLPLISLTLGWQVPAGAPATKSQLNPRQFPPAWVTVAPADRSELEAGIDELGKTIDALEESLKAKPALLALIPDVRIYHKAVRDALVHNEFFRARDIIAAKQLLQQGMVRASQLRLGEAPWDTATGLLARGYVSKIDGSVQPYGLVVPASYRPDSPHKFRLDVWCHGRNENQVEVSFIFGRQTTPGEFTPKDTFVLHPFGRYCNAYRFAGEMDLFEALDEVKKHYPIDDDRLVMRGFSMGGAACWQYAVHYPGMWAAAAPGAGFAETPEFLRLLRPGRPQPAWYEQKLWHLYDATGYALNLANCPTVAYSGEVDQQKQAADVMAKALAANDIEMVHIIGAKAGHQYTPAAKVEISRRIDQIARIGRDPTPVTVHFTTYTLRYNRAFWVQVDGLAHHWEEARVDADLLGYQGAGPKIETKNVSSLTLTFAPGEYPLDVRKQPKLEIDGNVVEAPRPLSDRSWTAHFGKVQGKWQPVAPGGDGVARKRHGLQGPIDDAFMDSFLIVRPTRRPLNDKVGKWTAAEMKHAIDHWRLQFRGEARVKDDKDVTDADIAACNLILWGDPSSNIVIEKIADKLPVKWNEQSVQLADAKYDAGHHVPVLIYPDPLNPSRYVVLNSGFTFREFDYTSNARQTPKLPDFAVVDVDVPVSPRAPGGIVTAGLFTEEWALPTSH